MKSEIQKLQIWCIIILSIKHLFLLDNLFIKMFLCIDASTNNYKSRNWKFYEVENWKKKKSSATYLHLKSWNLNPFLWINFEFICNRFLELFICLLSCVILPKHSPLNLLISDPCSQKEKQKLNHRWQAGQVKSCIFIFAGISSNGGRPIIFAMIKLYTMYHFVISF